MLARLIAMLEITPSLTIPEDELVERFVRSSGPGGQNVNKVASAVELRFDVVRSPSLPEPVRQRLLRLAGKQQRGKIKQSRSRKPEFE